MRLAVVAAEKTAAEAVVAMEAAKVVIAQYEDMGQEFPEHEVHLDGVVAQRAERCAEAARLISVNADKVTALQGVAHSASQHAATKCGQTVAARAVGYIALARASEAGQEATQTANKAIELQLRTLSEAEDALSRCQADAESSRQEMEDSRVAAAEAENLRVAIEEAETAQREREAAEFLLAEQRAAHGKAKLLLEAARVAEASADDFSTTANRIAEELELTLHAAQQAAISVDEVSSATSLALSDLQHLSSEAVELNNSVNDALFRTALLSNVAKQYQTDSAVFVTETDELFAAEHLAIEKEAIQLDYDLEAAEDCWHSENFSSVQRAAGRLPLAVQGAQLMTLMNEAALRKQEKIEENLSQARARTEAADAQSKVAGASVASSEASKVAHKSTSAAESVTTSSKTGQ